MIIETFRDAHRASRRKTGRSKGVTLIELAFVIAIIAIILVAILGIYNVVKHSQTLTEVTSDVAAIRQAVSTWASGGPVTYDQTSLNQGFVSLTGWNQLAGFLPGSLGRQARIGGVDSVLTAVNSWGCTYSLTFFADDRYKWSLKVDKIPTDVLNTLATRLRDGVVADEGEGDSLARGLLMDVGDEGQNNSALTLTYRH